MKRYSHILPQDIGFDIDCVVADTMEAFIRLAKDRYDLDVKPEAITSFNVEHCLPIDPSIVNDIFECLLVAPDQYDLKPMPDAVRVLTSLSDHAPLTFITARPLEEPIAEWLQNILPEKVYRNSRLVAMGRHDGKAAYVRKLGLQYFVDDRVTTCFELAESGLSPVVFSQHWNRGRHNLASIESWGDIEQVVYPS